MKAAPILLYGFGIGAIALAWWLRLDRPTSDPAKAIMAVTENAIRAMPAAESHAASRMTAPTAPETETEIEHVTRASSRPLATLHVVIESKLRDWRNTARDDPAIEEQMMQELLGLLSEEDTAEIVRVLSPESLHTPFGSGALERWLNPAPAEAAGWLAARTDATEHHAALVVRRLRESPAALLAFCDGLPASAWKQHLLQHASLGTADTNPAAAIAFAARLESGELQANACETIAYSWFERDPVAALRWVETVPEPALRERLLAVGAKAFARVDAGLALDWLIAGVTTERLVQETALSIVETTALAGGAAR